VRSAQPFPAFLLPLIVAVFFPCACSAPPVLNPAAPAQADLLTRTCLSRFPSGSFAVVHAIEASLPLENASTVVGVSSWEEGTRTLSAALLIPEGIALFEASRFGGGNVSVTRALPPLDRPDFADGLFDDLDFMYFPPGEGSDARSGSAVIPAAGHYPDGRSVCRWELDGHFVDLVPGEDGSFSLSEYRGSGEPFRRYEAGPVLSAAGFPVTSSFHRAGPAGYSMRFTLVEQ